MTGRDAVSALAELLARLGIRWALMGALAANRYRATTRTTQDADLLLLDAGPGIEALERALRDSGWTVRRATPDGAILRARHPTYGLADLITAGTEYEREALARSRAEEAAADSPVRVLAVEDVILFKLIAGRTQDVADVEAILAADPALDLDYLEGWARAWDVLDSWLRLRSAGPR
jgi:hypothetical protein